MKQQNRYCCRCHRTTKYLVEGTVYTCSECGVSVDVAATKTDIRDLVGNPFRSYRTTKVAA